MENIDMSFKLKSLMKKYKFTYELKGKLLNKEECWCKTIDDKEIKVIRKNTLGGYIVSVMTIENDVQMIQGFTTPEDNHTLKNTIIGLVEPQVKNKR